MPQNRYYCPGPILAGETLLLTEEEHHYLRLVMRQQVGEQIEIINGQGSLALGKILSIEKREAEIEIVSVTTKEPPPFTLRLVLGFLKPSHFEYACEKATEVGVTSFSFFPAHRSEKRAISDQYLKRLQSIVLSATKQCGRLFLPPIAVVDSLEKTFDDSLILFGDLEGQQSLTSATVSPKVSLVIGPESGFSEKERALLLSKGAKGLLLHQNILRAETAATIGIARLFEILTTNRNPIL